MLRAPAVLALGLLLIASASAQRGIAYANVGTFASQDLFDAEGQRTESSVAFTARTAEVGGELVIYDRPGLEGFVGAALHLGQTALEGAPIGGEATSGFEPQNAILAARITSELFTARTAFLLDLGSDDRTNPEAFTFTTDRQHAVLLGGTVRRNAGRLFLVGGGDAYLTFARENDAGMRVDDGDVYRVFVRGSVPTGPFTFGLTLQYIAISDITQTVNGQEQAFTDSDSYHVGLIPSVTYRPGESGLAITLQAGARGAGAHGGASQEYADFGIALAGKNATAPLLPFALRTRFEF